MSGKRTWLLVAVAVLAATVVAAAGARSTATFRAAIVTDTGNLNDRSFNQLANQGRLRAQRKLKIKTKVYISRSKSDYLPNFVAAGRANTNAIVANGFLLADDMSTAATQFPKLKWAIVDFPWIALKDKPKNAAGLTFKSEQSGYLVGYLGGLMAKKQGGKQVMGAVGGKKIPSVDNWIAGYRAGAKKANPGVTVLIQYSNQFPVSFAPKCKELANNMIQQGAQIIFQVAGGCGLGALDAAKQNHKGKRPVWGIGVDADQGYLGKHILTSGTKKVDVAVFDFIRDVKNKKFKGAHDYVFTLKNGGQGIGKISKKVPKLFVTKMNKKKKQIISGKIKPPATL
ncbi:MAG: BMP family ABC transporter substrate-binding protein [Actinomycetota bacterium]|nr:BMP family ABC transporter substrate-binding protein [Actinomycetota bacterium]